MNGLVVMLGSFACLGIKLGDGPVRIGRAPDNDIVLPLPEVADHHATLRRAGDAWSIECSPGETLRVCGRPSERAVLTAGQWIEVGAYRLRWAVETGDGGPFADRGPDTRRVGPVLMAGTPQSRLRLCVVRGPDQGREAALHRPVTIVGRAPDSDVSLTDDSVSWRHVAIETGTERGIVVRDLGSSNGTFVDGRCVGATTVGVGDRITLGETALEIREGPKPAVEPVEETRLVELVGAGPAMREVYARIGEAATSTLPVLFTGATGTGKRLAARALHTIGPRATGPFVPVHCAAMPAERLAHELFDDRAGAFARAREGTILLDEIAAAPPAVQLRLAQVLEGPGECRVVATTNHDLAGEIAAGRFRNDLFFRLAGFEIALPPLRDRLEDLPLLVQDLLESAGVRGAAGVVVDEQVVARLREAAWPGNVRQLRNVILRAVAHAGSGTIDERVIECVLQVPASPGASTLPPGSLEEAERDAIHDALRDCHGHRRAASRRLGIAESTLYLKIKRFGLERVGLEDRPTSG